MNNDFERFSEIMYGMADNFGSEISLPGLEMRWQMLGKYSMDQIGRAAAHILKTRKIAKMPTIAEFIEAIEGTPEDKAECEAMRVIDNIRLVGRYSQPRFEDPVTARVVGRMGWNNLCSMPEDQQKWFVRDFMEAYKAESRRQDTGLTEVASVEGGQVKRLLSIVTKPVSGAA